MDDDDRLGPLRARFETMRPAARARVTIVGNAPGTADLSAAIDAADWVVRFNEPFGWRGLRGTALTQLYLVSAGGQPEEWLAHGVLPKMPCIAEACSIVLAHDPGEVGTFGKGDSANQSAEMSRGIPGGKRVALYPVARFRDAVDALRPFSSRDRITPSTGFLAIHHHASNRHPHTPPILITGFGFAGWDGHDWEAERAWVARAESRGELAFIGDK